MSSAAGAAGGSSGHLRGILLVAAAVTSFSVLDSFAKYLSHSYPIPLVIWARYFFHVAIMVVLLWPTMRSRLLRTHRLDLQIMRGVALALSTLFFVSALSLMPLAEASAITQIAPVLLTLMAMRMLGERAPPGTWWALGVSFCGVLLIVRPGGQVFTWVAVLPLLTALCSAGYQLLTRKLAGVDDGLATLFIGGVVAAVLLSIPVPWFWQWPRNWFDAALFVGMGAVGAFSHLLLVRAFEHAPASRLAPFIYVQVVGALAMGLFIFGDFPDLTALAGIALIALTGVTMALRREAPLATPASGADERAMPGAAPGMALDGVPALVPVPAEPVAGPLTGSLAASAAQCTTASAATATEGAAAGSEASARAGPTVASEGEATRRSDGRSATRSSTSALSGSVTGREPAPVLRRGVSALPAPARGILLVVGACVMFSLLDSIAKHLSQSHHPLMVAWARYVFHVVIMVAFFAPSMGRRLFITRSPRLQVARGLCLGLSSICFFTSIAYLPLAEATAIVSIAPLLVTVGAVLWLKERTPRVTWVALALSFVGVLLIIRPGSALFGWAALLPLATAVFAMGYQLLTRQLTGLDNGLATLFIGGAVAALLLTVFAPGAWSLPTDPLDALFFVATGAIGALGHLMLVRAYEHGSASALAPFGYMHAVAALIFGFLFFDQFPDTLALIGLGLIVATGAAMAIRQRMPVSVLED